MTSALIFKKTSHSNKLVKFIFKTASDKIWIGMYINKLATIIQSITVIVLPSINLAGFNYIFQIVYLVFSQLGWATRKILGRFWNRSSNHFVAHSFCYWSADSLHWHEAAAIGLQFLCLLLDHSFSLSNSQIRCTFTSVINGPSFCRTPFPLPKSEATRMDAGFSRFLWGSISYLWGPANSWSSSPEFPCSGLQASPADVETAFRHCLTSFTII